MTQLFYYLMHMTVTLMVNLHFGLRNNLFLCNTAHRHTRRDSCHVLRDGNQGILNFMLFLA